MDESSCEPDLALPRAMRVPPEIDWTVQTAPPTPRHALLVNPFYVKDRHASFGKHALTPTLALTSVAAATPQSWSIAYHDENLLQGGPPVAPVPSVVGISVHLTFARRAYELARFYRERGAKVVLGGLHVMSCPDEAAPHADAIVLGDGVEAWPRVLADFERGALRARYVAPFTRPMGLDPPPRHSLAPKDSFLTTTSLLATRGCHNRCGFCYLATEGLRMPYKMRDPSDVANEWRAEGTPYAVFLDNNLGSNPRYLRQLCRALAPLEKIWSAAVSVDVSDDETLIREMALSGCVAVFIGFESLAMENLDDARKKTPRPEDYARRVEIFHRHGIAVNGSFVLGFDHDGPDVFDRTADWVEAARLECATFHILTPYPGTPLFRRLEAEGRLLHRNWDLYDTSHVVFRPAKMSAGELARGYARCYERLFSADSIWKRRPTRASEIPAYLLMSALYKRSNAIWPVLIRHRLTGAVWRPLVEGARRRHLHFRRRLARERRRAGYFAPVYAGV